MVPNVQVGGVDAVWVNGVLSYYREGAPRGERAGPVARWLGDAPGAF